jgi:hypothetical protein
MTVGGNASARLLWVSSRQTPPCTLPPSAYGLIEEQIDHPAESPQHLLPAVTRHVRVDWYMCIDNCRISKKHIRQNSPDTERF